MRKILLLCGVILALTACSSAETQTTQPRDQKDERMESRGKLTGDQGLSIFGGGKSQASQAGAPIGVNAYLWRATLDTLSFMPLASADPFGGTIITDWYEDPKAPGERFKVTALILANSLRADGIKITVFKQLLQKGAWRDQPVDDKLARSLEDTVLTRARQLKLNAGGK